MGCFVGQAETPSPAFSDVVCRIGAMGELADRKARGYCGECMAPRRLIQNGRISEVEAVFSGDRGIPRLHADDMRRIFPSSSHDVEGLAP